MELFKLLLIFHITGGTISLVTGFIILLSKKGDRRHRLIGTVYFYAMLTASLIAMPMCYLHPNAFLFIISVFTMYMLLTGKRYIRMKKEQKVGMNDWILTTVMACTGLLFLFFGLKRLLRGDTFGIVFLVFGSISLSFCFQDYINFTGKSKVKNFYLITHLQRLIGSYIAAVTAFIVVNNTILPAVVAWLLPTVLLVPLLIKWSRQYKVLKKQFHSESPMLRRNR
jgi:uncharacterized membrane protein